ncbi:hypothetical protein H7F33_06255 [Pedobacter sp. PAMC26386]|nr:hypothetical protein H7F33_06255 [Pedobacter sp. PAMC26386]
MKKTILFPLFVLLLFTLNVAAQSITGKVLDEQQRPIGYVNIQIGPSYNVVTNIEGVFIVNLQGQTKIDKVTISYIGFETRVIPLADFKDGTYVLKEQVNELDEVHITHKKMSPTEILAEVIKNVEKNYDQTPVKQTFFLRSSNINKTIDSKFELLKSSLDKKSSLNELNKDIEEMTNKSKNQISKDFSESYGFLYEQNKERKLLVEKAIELKNREKDVSGDQINSKVIEIIKKYLEPGATYNVRSGLFPVDDSLKIGSAKKDIRNDVKIASLKSKVTSLSGLHNKFYANKDLDFLTEYKRYTYALDGYATLNDETIYIIDFKPLKSSAKYSGKIYVNANDFAIVKLEYNMIEGKTGDHVNLKFLLGVKMIEDRLKVSATYSKNEMGQYAVNFVKEQKGIYLFMNRSLKFTKNKTDQKEEDKMLKIDLLVETDIYSINELFILNRAPINSDEFKKILEKEKYKINYMSKYDASTWNSYNILAPVEAIKNYK